MKGQEGKPIWIVVTLLLALVVGISMYQLMNQTNAQETFGNWLGEINAGQVEITLTSFCENWADSGFVRTAVNQDELAKASVAAAHPALTIKYFLQEEFELGERLDPCDCAVFLHNKGKMSLLDARSRYDPDDCHAMANEIAESTDIIGR
ncbi:MAG: hypothetical protein GOV00_04465 [Candidatus Altiarchaeota archaeon]|nr:hypothetical protein [Candidatus Altiarchaeota archaeon]